MFNGKTVSVIFPAYNEERNIRRAIDEFMATGLVDDLIVINNNSKDRTREEALKTSARVIDESIQGYGAALQRGLQEATSDYLVLAEPDGTFVPADLLKLLAYISDFEVVLGTRTAPELIWKGANMGTALRLGNVVVAKFLEFLFSGPCLTDCGCSFRLIRRDAYQRIASRLTVRGSHFLPEMVILALQEKLRVIEIPLNYCVRVGESKITGSWKGMVSTGLRMVWLIIRYRVGLPPHK